jgi:leader peptidase (prepilin peptidase)/N-methyltransferase
VSWLLLRGRCRHCGEPISVRYPLVELLTGGVFAALAARVGLDWALPAYLYLGAVLVALALIDIEHKRLPNVLTLPSYAAGIVLLGAAALLDGEPEAVLRALLGMAVLWGVYALLRLAHPKGMGYGDVKLAGVLGLYLAYLGWRTWFAGWLLGFLLGGVFGVVAILVGRAGRKTKVPFGPFMIVGAFVAILWGEALADWYLRLTGV